MKNLVLATHDSGVPADRRDTLLTTFLDPMRLIALFRDEIKVDAVVALES